MATDGFSGNLANGAARVARPASRPPARCERAWKQGTRVRVVAPGYLVHGKRGTVRWDTPAHGALIIDLDNGNRAACATNEAARLRDQGV